MTKLIEDRTALRVLADALCNVYHATHPHPDPHAENRYRGVEGINGVACDQHEREAITLMTEIILINRRIA